MIIEIHCKRWLLPKKTWGIVLYPFIFYRRKYYSETLRRHEWTHIRQIRRDGVFKFYFKILKDYATVGYRNSPYEIEAYEKQEDEDYEPWK